MNLKTETLEVLKHHKKSVDSVVWVGCEEFCIPTEDFWKLADREYDDGYGSAEVAPDLLVVGEDWWLERHEYDGSEWWEFKELPKKPFETRKVKSVISWGWETLEELNS